MVCKILSQQITMICRHMTCLGMLVLCMTSRTAHSIRIISPERAYNVHHIWYNDADWFNFTIPRCSPQAIETQCAKYGGSQCDSSLKCMCKCPLSRATLSLNGDEWQCTNYMEVRNRALCRYIFERETNNQQIVYLPTTGEKAYFNEPQNCDSCTIDMPSSRYRTCDGTWSPVTVNESSNIPFQLVHITNKHYYVNVNLSSNFPNLNGRLIKLVLNCNKTDVGEPCLLLKLRGYTDCDVTSEKLTQSCDAMSSRYSSPATPILPSSVLSEFQSPHPLETPVSTAYIGIKQVSTSAVVPTIKSSPENNKNHSDSVGDVTVFAAGTSPSGLLSISTSAASPTKNSSENKKQENVSDNYKIMIISASSAGGLLFIIFICTVFLVFRRRKRRNNNHGKRVLVEAQDQAQRTTEYSLQNMSAYEDVNSPFEGEQLSAENRLQIVQTKSSASSPEEKAAENPMYEDIAKKQPSEQAQNDASLYGSAEPYVQIPAAKPRDSKAKGSKVKSGPLSVPNKKTLPVYASVDMEKKIKERQQNNGSKQHICDNDTKDKEYAEPEVPSRLYTGNDPTQTKENNSQHYEEVVDTRNMSTILDGLKTKVSLGAPHSSEYDKPEGIILDDGRSILLPEDVADEIRQSAGNHADQGTAGTRNHQEETGGEEHKAKTSEPVYEEVVARDQLPVAPSRRPEIPGYDIPEGIVLDNEGSTRPPDGFAPFDVM